MGGLPPMNRRTTQLSGFKLTGYTVGSWSDTPEEEPTAVGLSLHVDIDATPAPVDFVLRLKTPASVDTLIQSLLRHKRNVWPDAP